MSNIRRITDMLIRHEDKRNKPYKDTVGKLTIGIGRNLDDVGLSDDEIDYLFSNDLRKVNNQLIENLPWSQQLDEVRYAVLVDMCFNLGINGLLGFKNTLSLIQQGKFEEASKNMLDSKWAKQVGSRATELSNMMKTGEWYAI